MNYPSEENLGENCMFWAMGDALAGCGFPKAELIGRLSCEGIIDDICLFIKDGRPPASMSREQQLEIKTRAPDLYDKSYLPPGNIR